MSEAPKPIPTVKWKCRWGWHEGRTRWERQNQLALSRYQTDRQSDSLACMSKSDAPIGWVVRVTMPDKSTGRPIHMFYVSGFFMPNEAEEAVKNARHAPDGETYEAVDPITASHGPKVRPREVHELSERP